MVSDSKSRRKVYSELSLQLIPEQVATEISSDSKTRAKRKKEAEKPLFLRRI